MARTGIASYRSREYSFWDAQVLLPFIAICWLLSGIVQVKLRDWEPVFVPPSEKIEEKIHPRLFQLMTFGHVPLGVDWLWIKALQDPGLDHVDPGTHPPLFYALDLATDLDPAFFDAYIVGANLLSVVRNDGPGARDLLEKAQRFRHGELKLWDEALKKKHWGNEWNIAMLLGYVYLFELSDMPHAAGAFREAGELPGAPAYLQSMSERLAHPGGEYEVGIRVLRFLQFSAKEDEAKAQIEKKLHSIYVLQHLFHASLQFREFLAKQPSYLRKSKLRGPEMQSYWRQFVKKQKAVERDPFNGHVYLNENGKIVSSTPHEPVLGFK